jgi:hypothetical protein
MKPEVVLLRTAIAMLSSTVSRHRSQTGLSGVSPVSPRRRLIFVLRQSLIPPGV